MDPQDSIDLTREALTMVAIIGGPILAAGLAIGLIVGIFQAMTQIQDQTVSAVPKILGMLLVTMLVLPWVGERMIDYTRETLATPMMGGLAPQSKSPTHSPYTQASAKTRLAPNFQSPPVERIAANLPPRVAPPLKPPTTVMPTMPTMKTKPTSMPVHPSGQSPRRRESSMPQFRGGSITAPPAHQNDLEG